MHEFWGYKESVSLVLIPPGLSTVLKGFFFLAINTIYSIWAEAGYQDSWKVKTHTIIKTRNFRTINIFTSYIVIKCVLTLIPAIIQAQCLFKSSVNDQIYAALHSLMCQPLLDSLLLSWNVSVAKWTFPPQDMLKFFCCYHVLALFLLSGSSFSI